MSPPETIRVALPDRPYDVLVGAGLIAELGSHVKTVSRARRVGLVTDAHVAPLYLARAEASLAAAGLTSVAITLEAGEQTKSFAHLALLLDKLLGAEIERSDMLVALGGGVIGDLTGLAASLLRRGIDFVQVPTSLLAQVDSSVGGKTGIDTPHGKNLVGSFHQPARVLADTDTLKTLPPRELRAGYAEIVKNGLINDAPFFAWCEENGLALLAGDAALQRRAIVTSVRAKAAVVIADEKEQGERALLNLGHTFGHALEVGTGYGGALLHGEAIAIGMCLAFALSAELKLAPPADAARIARHFADVGLPTRIQDIAGGAFTAESLVGHMMQDKKKSEGRLALVLARGIGQAFVTRDVELPVLTAFLTRVLSPRP
jgi:3-dehydroquinate synthase